MERSLALPVESLHTPWLSLSNLERENDKSHLTQGRRRCCPDFSTAFSSALKVGRREAGWTVCYVTFLLLSGAHFQISGVVNRGWSIRQLLSFIMFKFSHTALKQERETRPEGGLPSKELPESLWGSFCSFYFFLLSLFIILHLIIHYFFKKPSSVFNSATSWATELLKPTPTLCKAFILSFSLKYQVD